MRGRGHKGNRRQPALRVGQRRPHQRQRPLAAGKSAATRTGLCGGDLGVEGWESAAQAIPATATSTWRPPASRRSQATRRSAQSTNSFIALATDPPPPLQPGRRALWVRTTGGRKEEAAANPPLSEANDGYQRRQVREVSNRGCAGMGSPSLETGHTVPTGDCAE